MQSNPRQSRTCGSDRGVSAIEYCVMVLVIVFAFIGALPLVGAAINGMLVQAANAF